MKVIWSKQALNDLESLADYLFSHWGEDTGDKYLLRINELVIKISTNPKMYPESKIRRGVRRCVISKHNTLYYRVLPHHIEVITVFDNRQNSDKRKL